MREMRRHSDLLAFWGILMDMGEIGSVALYQIEVSKRGDGTTVEDERELHEWNLYLPRTGFTVEGGVGIMSGGDRQLVLHRPDMRLALAMARGATEDGLWDAASWGLVDRAPARALAAQRSAAAALGTTPAGLALGE